MGESARGDGTSGRGNARGNGARGNGESARGSGASARGRAANKKPRSHRNRAKKHEGEIVPRIDNYEDARVQALMVGDKARTGAYYNAVMENKHLFEGKVVMDVGAGQGILSMFAAKAGAKKVYAVERSRMARVATALVKANKLDGIVEVCNKDVDLLEVPDKVDVVISEWMGIGLVHERMLEVVLRARDKFLKPASEGGVIFPTTATMSLAPLWEDNSESELFSAETWTTSHHFGIDWTVAQRMLPYDGPCDALTPGIGWPLQRILIAPNRIKCKPVEKVLDLRTISVHDATHFTIPFEFPAVDYPTVGYGCWFSVDFLPNDDKTGKAITLGTGPNDVPTHWRQLAMYRTRPLPADKVPEGGIKGVFKADINPKTSGYFFEIDDNVNTNLYMDSANFLWQECR